MPLERDCMLEKINFIKTPNDILEFMKENIKYGWLDCDGLEHIGNLKGFRQLYRTSSIDKILQYKIGTCIEQVFLMKYLFDKINIESHMYCTRVYEDSNFNDIDADEHMHCFLLYFMNDKVYQIEHPNWERIGIYEFNSVDDAISEINEYYVNMAGGVSRPVTEFYDVVPNLSFKEFNNYINELDSKIKK